MTAQAFGQFLVQEGLIAQEDLNEALGLQQAFNPLLGDLAVAAGWMTAAEADEVNRLQRRRDAKFGEIAQELGYLTPKQVADVIDLQAAERRLLGQILVDLGKLDSDALDHALERHRAPTHPAGPLTAIPLGDEELADLTRYAVEAVCRQYLRQNRHPLGLSQVLDAGAGVPAGAVWQQELRGRSRYALCLETPAGGTVPAEETGGVADDDAAAFLRAVAGQICARMARGPNNSLAPRRRGPAYRPLGADYRPVFRAVLDAPGGSVALLVARA